MDPALALLLYILINKCVSNVFDRAVKRFFLLSNKSEGFLN